MADNETKKYLDKDGLLYVKQKIKTQLDTKVDKVTGKGLSTNDLTDALKQTYDETVITVEGLVAEGGEANIIETVKVNGSALTPDANKAVDVTVPTKMSDLTNDGDGTTGSKFATEDYVDTNGGKIDKIKVNNVEQTITNKTVNITTPTKISDLTNDDNTVKDANYVHTDNNFTNAKDTKLTGIAEGAQVNVLESIKVNGTAQTITAKAVNISVPTNNNELTNGAGYQTASDVETAITGKGYQTETQVNSAITSAIAGVTQFDYSIVTSLPATGVKGTIYLISNSGSGTNIYDEYIWVNNKWEMFGTTEVDLSGYVQDTDLVAITNAEIDTIFA